MIVITGSTSGIGLELAIEYATRGKILFLTGRNEEVLNVLKRDLSTKVYTFACDLSQADSASVLIAEIEKTGEEVELFVNNAGYGLSGGFVDLPILAQTNMIELNVKSLVKLSYYASIKMKEQGYGQILNVASVVGMVPTPSMSIYAASKAFVRSFTLSLNYELAGTGVSAHVLSPGTTSTNFFDRAGASRSKFNPAMTPQAVAKCAVAGLEKGKHEIVPGILNKKVSVALKVAPVVIAAPIMYKVLKSK